MFDLVLTVALLCTLVLLGWIVAGDTWVTHIVPGAVTMKPATALSLAMLGLGMLLTRRRRWAVGIAAGAAVLLWLAQFDAAPFLDFEETGSPAWSVAANVPSWATTVAATAVALGVWTRAWWLFAIAGAIGSIALLGYVVASPTLFFYVSGASTAMAFHTAVCFCILGTAGAVWSVDGLGGMTPSVLRKIRTPPTKPLERAVREQP